MTTQTNGYRNTVKDTGSQGRKDLLNFDPDDLELIEDPNHILFDPRVHLPVDEGFVESISKGISTPIRVRRNGDKMQVVVGRQRVKAARIAKKRGVEILVPAWVVRGTDAELYDMIVEENEQREDTPPTMRALQAQKLLNLGRSEEEVAKRFRVGSIKNILAILDLHPEVQKAVDEKAFSASLAAVELVKLPREEQVEEMNKLLASGVKGEIAKETLRRVAQERGKVEGAKSSKRKVAPKSDEPIARMRTRLAVEAAIANLKDAPATKTIIAVRAVLRWVTGHDRAFNQCPDLGKTLRGETT